MLSISGNWIISLEIFSPNLILMCNHYFLLVVVQKKNRYRGCLQKIHRVFLNFPNLNRNQVNFLTFKALLPIFQYWICHEFVNLASTTYEFPHNAICVSVPQWYIFCSLAFSFFLWFFDLNKSANSIKFSCRWHQFAHHFLIIQ